MSATYRRIVVRPAGVEEASWSRLGELLSAAVARQRALVEASRHVLRFTSELHEDSDHQTYYVEHEPASPCPIGELFDRVPPPVDTAGLISDAYAIFAALSAAPQTTVPAVHGGICPGVVLYDAQGLLKLTDFGFAPALCSVLGTPRYLNLAVGAPGETKDAEIQVTGRWEVLPDDEFEREDRLCAFIDPEKYGSRNLGSFEPASDVVAAGFLLHLLAEHQHPYLYLDADAHKVVAMSECMDMGHYNGARRNELRQSTHPGVQAWCQWVASALSRLPKDRPTAGRIAEALRPFKSDAPSRVMRIPTVKTAEDGTFHEGAGGNAVDIARHNPEHILDTQRSDHADLTAQVRGRIEAAKVKIRLSVDPKKIARQVERITFRIKARGAETIELTATWDEQRAAFMFPSYWQSRLDDYAASASAVPKEKTGFGRRAAVLITTPLLFAVMGIAWWLGSQPDLCPADANKKAPGLCGCGVPDVDADRDAFMDCPPYDLCPNNPNKQAPGLCGCEQSDEDRDGDRVADCLDKCPSDPAKVEPGRCGCLIPDTDTDGDQTPDCDDECDEDPKKVLAGTCGCGRPETQGCLDPSRMQALDVLRNRFIALENNLTRNPSHDFLMQAHEQNLCAALADDFRQWSSQGDPKERETAPQLGREIDDNLEKLETEKKRLASYHQAFALAASTLEEWKTWLEIGTAAFPTAELQARVKATEAARRWLNLVEDKRKGGDWRGQWHFLERAVAAADPVVIQELEASRAQLLDMRKIELETALGRAGQWLQDASLPPTDPADHIGKTAECSRARSLLDALDLDFVAPDASSADLPRVDDTRHPWVRVALVDETNQGVIAGLLRWTTETVPLVGTEIQLTFIPDDRQRGILDSFWMSRTELTLGQIQAVDKAFTDRKPEGMGDKVWDELKKDPRHPAAGLSWNQAEEIRGQFSSDRFVLRFPSEAEWRHAAACGGIEPLDPIRAFPAQITYDNEGMVGLDISKFNADSLERIQFEPLLFKPPVHRDGFGLYAPVAAYPPNRWLLHDLLGNVSEWVTSAAGRGPTYIHSSFRSLAEEATAPQAKRGQKTLGMEEVGLRFIVAVQPQ